MSSKSVQNEEDPFEIYDLDSGRKLLREYSGISNEDVKSHVELIVSHKPLLPSINTDSANIS